MDENYESDKKLKLFQLLWTILQTKRWYLHQSLIPYVSMCVCSYFVYLKWAAYLKIMR